MNRLWFIEVHNFFRKWKFHRVGIFFDGKFVICLKYEEIMRIFCTWLCNNSRNCYFFNFFENDVFYASVKVAFIGFLIWWNGSQNMYIEKSLSFGFFSLILRLERKIIRIKFIEEKIVYRSCSLWFFNLVNGSQIICKKELNFDFFFTPTLYFDYKSVSLNENYQKKSFNRIFL